jgi:hypothetical protein
LEDRTLVGISEDLIDLFGGIRFRHMDLSYANGVQLLLYACAEKLEILRFCPAGEGVFPKELQLASNQ